MLAFNDLALQWVHAARIASQPNSTWTSPPEPDSAGEEERVSGTEGAAVSAADEAAHALDNLSLSN